MIQDVFININLINLVMLGYLAKAARLTTTLVFSVARARRHPAIPTQASTITPFSIQFLHDNPGSTRKPKKLGRGPGSGKGYSFSHR